MKVLFLVKENYSSGGYQTTTAKSGLLNSAKFIKKALEERLDVTTDIRICVDGNAVDKEVADFKPDYVIIEALWITPEKIKEIADLHSKVEFIIRIHSNIPFLSNEGIAIEWIKKEFKIAPNVKVAYNNLDTSKSFQAIGLGGVYLPNIYFPPEEAEWAGSVVISGPPEKKIINIGCFGAIRPLKNQLIQAVAAIQYGEANKKDIIFHINSGRVEQKGDEALKNIRALFEGTRHQLVEWPWMEHEDFLQAVGLMDIGLQVSFTESFNIVTADFVHSQKPVVVSPDIDWVVDTCRTTTNSSTAIAKKIKDCLLASELIVRQNVKELEAYNMRSLQTWKSYFNI